MFTKNIRDFLSVAFGQIINMLISIVRSLILPIYLSVLQFGYFQSYLFYISLLPLIALGYNDGVYLRYGKYSYEELPKKILSSSNGLFIAQILILSIIVPTISMAIVNDTNLRLVIFCSSSYSFFNCINSLILQIYQITQKFNEYVRLSIFSRLISLIAIIAVILFDKITYLNIIIADLISFSAIILYHVHKNAKLFNINIHLKDGYNEYKNSIYAGFPLLISGLIGILFMGGGRLIVQIMGGITDFAMYSFSISLASFVSVAISSMSTVVYPMISRYNENERLNTFNKLNCYLRLSIILVFPLYAISELAITYIYPHYKPTLYYLGIVFGMTYIQSFIYVLQNTYYKSYRKEKNLLQDNIISIIVLFILGIPLYYLTQNVISIAIITMVAMFIRYNISYFRLKTIMHFKGMYNHVEFFSLFVFILSTTVELNTEIKYTILTIVLSAYIIYNLSTIKIITR